MGKAKKINARRKYNNADKIKINKDKIKDGPDFISFNKPLSLLTAPVTKEPVKTIENDKKYAILSDKILQEKFMSVSMNNNQKGRLRQLLRDNLKGPSTKLLPDLINSRIQTILETEALTPPALRKIRILFNMLKTAIENQNKPEKSTKVDAKSEAKIMCEKDSEDGCMEEANEKNTAKVSEDCKNSAQEDREEEAQGDCKKEAQDGGEKEIIAKEVVRKEDRDIKKRGPKRYVVFVGNLPLDVNKEKLQTHFKDILSNVKDIRIPKVVEGKKSSIAYLEMENELSYEMALSKHHSMFENRRINVFYSTQKNSKITKSEAKGKAAKMVALQKSGKLVGSIPMNRKRSFRRKKQREALAKMAAQENE